MKIEKKSFGCGKKKDFGSNTDTEIRPWFWFPISKLGFGYTLYWIHGRGIGMSKIQKCVGPNLPFQLKRVNVSTENLWGLVN